MLQFTHPSKARVAALIVVWLFVGGEAFADSLDLTDDIGIPITDTLQAINPDSVDEVKQGLDLVRSLSHCPSTVGAFAQENFPFLSSILHGSYPQSPSADIPLYESLCTYRL
ncbi:MAG TPA: hypothetical protein VEI50_00845 [Nitrospiraceae bacterium]|nr:hypothetical protein [Nitrospiraceae bacterium]